VALALTVNTAGTIDPGEYPLEITATFSGGILGPSRSRCW